MKPENMPQADFVTSLLLMAFGIWIIVHSWQMPRFEALGADPFSVPGIVPGLLGLIIFALALVVFVRALRQKGYRLQIGIAAISTLWREPSMRRMWLTIAICIGYGIGLVGKLNYYLATFVFVLLFLILFQYRRSDSGIQTKLVFGAVVQAGLTAGVVGAVFRYLFLVDLP